MPSGYIALGSRPEEETFAASRPGCQFRTISVDSEVEPTVGSGSRVERNVEEPYLTQASLWGKPLNAVDGQSYTLGRGTLTVRAVRHDWNVQRHHTQRPGDPPDAKLGHQARFSDNPFTLIPTDSTKVRENPPPSVLSYHPSS